MKEKEKAWAHKEEELLKMLDKIGEKVSSFEVTLKAS